ncbi:Dabb family protein [Planctomicrobium sp. SH664]|uniref:Dabb family protein n=1 Tax=Planctomicrobium sp. SH664 TaxID=3448125 RepID=UPI003F5BAC0C
MNRFFISLSLISMTGVVLMQTLSTGAAEKPARELRHLVLYKFKEDQSPQQVQEVVDKFLSMQKLIPEISAL